MATFVFNDREMSRLRVQVAQESSPNAKFNIVGDTTPTRVDEYVDADMSALSLRVGRERIAVAKLAMISLYGNYPWPPGEIFRYRTVDSFVLAFALDALVKAQEGPDATLWDLLTAEVFAPLGLGRVPIAHTREPDREQRIPQLGSGMILTAHEAIRLAQLLQAGGRWQDGQILKRSIVEQAINTRDQLGLPTGWTYKEGGEAHYDLGLWRIPHTAGRDCHVFIPAMSGFGGNYVLLMPGSTIGIRFADGHYNDPSTWDSTGLRNTANQVRPFCP